jgi:hypothetical protein
MRSLRSLYENRACGPSEFLAHSAKRLLQHNPESNNAICRYQTQKKLIPVAGATMEGHSHAIDGPYPMWRSRKRLVRKRGLWLATDRDRFRHVRALMVGIGFVLTKSRPCRNCCASLAWKKAALKPKGSDHTPASSKAGADAGVGGGRRDKALRCVADPSARPRPCDARLPHLVGLSRYETRASARRDRAILPIAGRVNISYSP